MKTYTGQRNLYGTLTNDNSSANLTLGDELMNDTIRRVCAERDWDFLQKTATSTTVASTQFYNLPADYDELIDVTVISGTTVYVPKECPSRQVWDLLNQNTSITSNVPEYYFIFNKQLGFYPTPSSNGNTITYAYRKRIIDLTMADYSTGTIDTITNGSTTVVGSGTSWTSPMAGRDVRLTMTNVAATSGDQFWYDISSITNGTTLVLSRPYGGTTLGPAAGAAYTMGQVSPLPEAYQDIPVYKAAEIYFTSVQPEPNQAKMFKELYNELHAGLIRDHSSKTLNPAIEDDESARRIINPNLTIFL